MDDGARGTAAGGATTGVSVLGAVREARASKQPLRIVGARTWLNAGRPVQSSVELSLAHERGIVEYVPGDLTLTARAGTSLAEIEEATRPHGQWLPLDPWGGDQGTLGATLSTATAGPHSYAMGLPRDVVLGMEFVTGAGNVVRSGGRVVKNVAGFDLTRLMVGSWGTLGVITSATVRLRARPDVTRTLALDVATNHTNLNALAATLRALPFTPLACELVNDTIAARLGGTDRAVLLVRIGGNERAVRGQTTEIEKLGDTHVMDENVWTTLRAIEPAGASTWRWSQPPAQFGDTWSAADRATRALGPTLMHGSPLRGVVRMISPESRAGAAELSRHVRSFAGTVAVERLPAASWSDVPSAVAMDAISVGIRRTFDPDGILNPGILGSPT